MLPQVQPMLAVASAPFDNAEYCFEIKWDGIRALAAVDERGWRLWGRGGVDYTSRYPELEVLRRWPQGTLVDGELVRLRGGLPDLPGLLQRHFLAAPWQIAQARHWCPVLYVVFDLLYQRGRCLLREPLGRRRDLLAELCARTAVPGLLLSAGVLGAGQAFYEAVVAAGHEGVMAKALVAPYRPGRRSPTWRKIKPRRNGAGRCPRPAR